MLLRRIAAALGYSPSPRPEPESARYLRRLAERLNDSGAKFGRVAARIVMLSQRIEVLGTESDQWELRAQSQAVQRDPDLARDVARICGRIEGKLDSARSERVLLELEERLLRDMLVYERRRFMELLEDAQALGVDVSRCLLTIDLTRPEPPADPATIPEDEADFVARVVDSRAVH